VLKSTSMSMRCSCTLCRGRIALLLAVELYLRRIKEGMQLRIQRRAFGRQHADLEHRLPRPGEDVGQARHQQHRENHVQPTADLSRMNSRLRAQVAARNLRRESFIEYLAHCAR